MTKIAHFTLIISRVTAWKFTKFLHDEAEPSTCYLFKVAKQQSNPLSNVRADSEGGQFQRLQIAAKSNWLL